MILRIISCVLLVSFGLAPVCASQDWEQYFEDAKAKPSTIGDLDWDTDIQSTIYRDIELALGAVIAAGDSPKKAVGLYISDTSRGQNYVLTARHTLYNEQGEREKKAFIGYNSIKVILELDLSGLPDRVDLSIFEDDIVLVPAFGSDTRIPKVSFNQLFAVDLDRPIEEIGMLSLLIDDRSILKIVQENASAIPSTKDRTLRSDVDVILGMSGSPIFIRQADELRIIGVVASSAYSINGDPITCNLLTQACSNGIAPVTANLLQSVRAQVK